ncbi:OmpA family protein [Alkalimonas collagenimarina]|uniref:OmpA family protein n=1 Tax=Alkalimonas collagenimarina TaxID=400390 RepID=A0ABT9H0X7_9GAMM|nr:OmpA family protein [Alkalimonas collagenimarina]MDP4536951.1 OmpA family protein [Alkalimonas collagenimarina]
MRRFHSICLIIVLGLLLAGCQSTQGLTNQQVRVLMQEGFEPFGDEWVLNLSVLLLFGFDQDKLSEASKAEIRRLSGTLQSIGINNLRIEGHADATGDEEYNLQLSQRRADRVAEAFISFDTAESLITTKGMGSTLPISTNNTADGRAQNRRVSIIVGPDF